MSFEVTYSHFKNDKNIQKEIEDLVRSGKVSVKAAGNVEHIHV
jgi:hypothetical protein